MGKYLYYFLRNVYDYNIARILNFSEYSNHSIFFKESDWLFIIFEVSEKGPINDIVCHINDVLFLCINEGIE